MSHGWGLLGPDTVLSQRRVRTLQLLSAIQEFNERAMPGLGNVRFAKQFFLALLGIAVVERVRASGYAKKLTNIETANAVEALACLYSIREGEQENSKVLGKRKLQGISSVPKFSQARQRGFYVSIPWRMATGQPLSALGFVQQSGERFNSFTLSKYGRAFVDACCEPYEPCWYNQGVLELLKDWVTVDALRIRKDSKLRKALMPQHPLPRNGLAILRERLESGCGSERRNAIFTFVQKSWPNWEERPQAVAEEHWNDLYLGSRLFMARDAALSALDSVENRMADKRPVSLPEAVRHESTAAFLAALRGYASEFLQSYREQHVDAKIFCEQCSREDDMSVLRELVKRDGTCLVLVDDRIVPGSVFLGQDVSSPDEAEEEGNAPPDASSGPALPQGISHRVRNARALLQEFAKNPQDEA